MCFEEARAIRTHGKLLEVLGEEGVEVCCFLGDELGMLGCYFGEGFEEFRGGGEGVGCKKRGGV